MSLTRNRKTRLWVIGITVISTSVVLVILQNFKAPEKVMEQKVEHRYTTVDPQFRREMSVLPGPAITGGNQITALQNGDEIFPVMLQAIRLAQWESRPLREKLPEMILMPIKSQL